jgi:hypothetical protein
VHMRTRLSENKITRMKKNLSNAMFHCLPP